MAPLNNFGESDKFTLANAADVAVHDMSRPALVRAARLTGWPGLGLRSLRPATPLAPAEERTIDVKCRVGSGGMEVSRIERAKACVLRDRYWLHVAFAWAPPRPRLVKAQTPSGKLLAKAKNSMILVNFSRTEMKGRSDAVE